MKYTFYLILVKMFFVVHARRIQILPKRTSKMAHYGYRGCYKQFFQPGQDLPVNMNKFLVELRIPSLTLCLHHCITHRTNYAAVSDSKMCGCANDISPEVKVREDGCDVVCMNPPFLNTPCGGMLRWSVYELVDKTISKVFYGCFAIKKATTAQNVFKPLEVNSVFSADNTAIDTGDAGMCIKHCHKYGHKFAAIFKGESCGCGNARRLDRTKSVDMACDFHCEDMKLGTCGGLHAEPVAYMSVWQSDRYAVKMLDGIIDPAFVGGESKWQDSYDEMTLIKTAPYVPTKYDVRDAILVACTTFGCSVVVVIIVRVVFTVMYKRTLKNVKKLAALEAAFQSLSKKADDFFENEEKENSGSEKSLHSGSK